MSVFILLIGLISGIIYFSVSRYLEKDFNHLLMLRAKSLASWHLDNPEMDQKEEVSDRLLHEKDFIFDLPNDLQSIADSTGVPLHFVKKAMQENTAYLSKGGFRYVALLHKAESSKKTFLVIAGANNPLGSNLNGYLFQLLIYVFIASFILALICSFVLSKYLFRPIKKITNRVNQISSENLHLRLPTKNVSDEVNELTVTFNEMLNRIETSFEIQNNFVSNASHELRTPLTTIIGEADLALSKERSMQDYQEALKIILEEAELLDSKTKALLFLAQTGFNGKTQQMDVLRVDQLILDTKELVEKLDKRHKIVLNFSLLPDNPKLLKVKGNYQLLQLALSNIIVNSSKYSSYQEVVVSLGSSDSSVYVLISDSGIGIPMEELKFIYDPFFRASNTHSYEGYGIGLPLTKNIIDLHHGEIIVHSDVNKGTVVRINLPIFHA